eukprot:ANDGO_03666.mRNA.1 hypothetical protein
MRRSNIAVLLTAILVCSWILCFVNGASTEQYGKKNKYKKTANSKFKLEKMERNPLDSQQRERLRTKIQEHPEWVSMMQKAIAGDPSIDIYSMEFQTMASELSSLLPRELQEKIWKTQEKQLNDVGVSTPAEIAQMERSIQDDPLAGEFKDEM